MDTIKSKITDLFELKNKEINQLKSDHFIQDDSDSDDDDTAALMAELQKIKREKAEEEQEKVIQYYTSKGKSQSDAENLSKDEDEYTNTFFVPDRARWKNLESILFENELKIQKICCLKRYNATWYQNAISFAKY